MCDKNCVGCDVCNSNRAKACIEACACISAIPAKPKFSEAADAVLIPLQLLVDEGHSFCFSKKHPEDTEKLYGLYRAHGSYTP